MNVKQAFSLPQAKSLLYKSFRTAIERLFTRGFLTPRDKLLFAIALFSVELALPIELNWVSPIATK
ncbi:hypothetical protein IQ272_04905 [Chroococcidiopsidales cyanobacterium LEGE 13417]|nr:hypothetical protein [Chroococcidiopsidales cyanobacterium LEGE 13417]